ncbi:ABC transporter ATP-binding protein [Rhodococcus qingshengii]|uniref:ABC transporter ATP-binding protein n=1 Tax=Rhodococcus qingshengii TaxID=334542 RepID=UPI00366A2D73
MTPPPPTPSVEAHDDADGLVVESWQRRLRWTSLPRQMWGALAFTVRSAPLPACMTLAAGIANAAIYAVLYLILQRLIDEVSRADTVGDVSLVSLRGILTAAVALGAARMAIGFLQSVMHWRLQEFVFRKTDFLVLRASLDVPLLRYENSEYYPLLQRCSNSVNQISVSIPRVVSVVSGLATAIALTVTLSSWNPWLAALSVVSALPALLAQIWGGRLWYRAEASVAWPARLRYYISNITQSRSAAAEIRTFQLAGALYDWSENAWKEMFGIRSYAWKRRKLVESVAQIVSVAILVVGVLLVLSSGNRAAAMSVVIPTVAALIQLRLTFASVFDGVSAISDASLYLNDVAILQSIAAETRSTATTPEIEANNKYSEPVTVRGRSLTFTYPGSPKAAVDRVDITVASGELIALVGKNGSGKTTLSKLLAGLIPPTSGALTWNGLDYIRAAGDVQAGVTVQFQNPIRWCFTAKENIWLGDTTTAPDDTRLRHCLQQSGAAESILALPQGLDTRLGQELGPGSDLSGGEWQRLALARCFYRNSQLVILDEATSAMDALGEARFVKSLRTLLHGRGGVLITHRFANLKMADRIYVMDQGQVVDVGTHETLLVTSSLYQDLYNAQVQNL